MNFENIKSVLQEVLLENERQYKKWGTQNHTAFPWLAILGEEVGECNNAALEAHFSKKKSWTDLREELIQTAAVCVAFIDSLDRNELNNNKIDLKNVR